MSLGSVNLLKLFFRTNMAATSSSEMIADNPSSENCELLPGFKDVSEYSQVNYMLLSHFVVLYLYGSLLISLLFDLMSVVWAQTSTIAQSSASAERANLMPSMKVKF